MENWLEEKGIVHELSPPMIPQCNGVAERCNRTIIETVRTILADARLDLRFWGEAVNIAIYTKQSKIECTWKDSI